MPMATQDDIAGLLRRIDYRSVDLRDVDSVAAAVSDLVHRKCVSYLAIPPGLYISTCEGLAKGGALAAPARLMLEKPIGSDSESAEEIISTIGQWIDEDRVFRLDHYLGKAAVQNLIALRFGNTLLEAVWNRNYIESVHILVAESEGVDGRDAYYAPAVHGGDGAAGLAGSRPHPRREGQGAARPAPARCQARRA
ncbi:hypothetical protein G6F66_014037 [Rhizopus arrhizus]|nr:hypothetical protein G6F66_014037 [Rhizopus arrhizus]